MTIEFKTKPKIIFFATFNQAMFLLMKMKMFG